MAVLIPFLSFRGTCEQALTFYCGCFDGKVVSMQRYVDVSSAKTLSVNGQHISHAEFAASAIKFMACDVADDGRSASDISSIGVSLALQFDNLTQQESVFKSLAQSAEVVLPLTKQFWGARYAELVDQWGIHWRLNCQIDF